MEPSGRKRGPGEPRHWPRSASKPPPTTTSQVHTGGGIWTDINDCLPFRRRAAAAL